MRRIGWFLAGATATAVTLWKVPAVRNRLVGPDPAVDLPPAADPAPGWPGGEPGDVTWAPQSTPAEPAEAVTAAMPVAADVEPDQDVEDTAEVESEAVGPPDDPEAAGLRGRIEETRARMREKARSEAERTRSS